MPVQYFEVGLVLKVIRGRELGRIYVRIKKVTGKKVSGKINLEIKTLVKKSQFSEVLGQNVSGGGSRDQHRDSGKESSSLEYYQRLL